MLVIYYQEEKEIRSVELVPDTMPLFEKAIWIDMISPTQKEEKFIEEILQIDIPTKKEMEEIEPSNRLYSEDDALFMTTTMVAFSDLPTPKSEVVTFILTDNKLITVRYIELNAFKVFINRLLRKKTKKFNSATVLLGLLDSITERLADILESISRSFDDNSHKIFHTHDNGNDNSEQINYKNILQDMGSHYDLGNKVRESIVSFIRLISFLEQTKKSNFTSEMDSHLKIVKNDIQALSDYAGFMSTRVNFLLDATLGMINIEQNNIIKIFSVAAVIFLPPTLIASMYGMNFKFMPELHWALGYPFAILLMLISAFIPYRFFKKKKWL